MNRHLRIRTFGTALLMTAALSLPGAARAAGDPSVLHVDGYVEMGRCPTLREHDGKVYGLVGAVGGLRSGDHVRLEGRLVVGVVNFPPRQIGPVRSEVLVLGAVADDHPVLLLEPDAGSQPGDRIA